MLSTHAVQSVYLAIRDNHSLVGCPVSQTRGSRGYDKNEVEDMIAAVCLFMWGIFPVNPCSPM